MKWWDTARTHSRDGHAATARAAASSSRRLRGQNTGGRAAGSAAPARIQCGPESADTRPRTEAAEQPGRGTSRRTPPRSSPAPRGLRSPSSGATPTRRPGCRAGGCGNMPRTPAPSPFPAAPRSGPAGTIRSSETQSRRSGSSRCPRPCGFRSWYRKQNRAGRSPSAKPYVHRGGLPDRS